MTDLSPYAKRAPRRAPSPAVAVGGEKPGTCAACQTGGARSRYEEEEDDCYYQRVPLFQEIPAADPASTEGRDFVIEVNHRGDLFLAKSMFLEAYNADGTINRFAYLRAFEIDEDRQDCISGETPRGVPVHVYSQQGGCCDGLRVCISEFANQKDRRSLKIHIRVFGGTAGVIQGYLRGRCRDCGYEKYCQTPMPRPEG